MKTKFWFLLVLLGLAVSSLVYAKVDESERLLKFYDTIIDDEKYSLAARKQAVLGIQNHFDDLERFPDIQLANISLKLALNSERVLFNMALDAIVEIGDPALDALVMFLERKPCDTNPGRLESCALALHTLAKNLGRFNKSSSLQKISDLLASQAQVDSYQALHLMRIMAEACLQPTGLQKKYCKEIVHANLKSIVDFYENDGASDVLAVWILNDGPVIVEEIDDITFFNGRSWDRKVEPDKLSSLFEAYLEVADSISRSE